MSEQDPYGVQIQPRGVDFLEPHGGAGVSEHVRTDAGREGRGDALEQIPGA